jgi:hypothetical protein
MSPKYPVTLQGIDPGTVGLVAQRLNQYATPGPDYNIINLHISECIWLLLLKGNHQCLVMNNLKNNKTSQNTLYHMPTPKCFGTKVPSSGNFSTAKFIGPTRILGAGHDHKVKLSKSIYLHCCNNNTTQRWACLVTHSQPFLLPELCTQTSVWSNAISSCWREGGQRLKYVLDLRTYVVDKLPDNGAETRRSWHLIWSVFCDLFYCIVISVFWFLKHEI